MPTTYSFPPQSTEYTYTIDRGVDAAIFEGVWRQVASNFRRSQVDTSTPTTGHIHCISKKNVKPKTENPIRSAPQQTVVFFGGVPIGTTTADIS